MISGQGSGCLAKLNDFVQRVKTAFFLIAAILIVLLVDNVLLPLVVMLFITFAMNEYLRFWHRKDIYPHTLAVLLPAYTIPWLYFFRIPAVFTAFLLFMFIALLSVMRFPGSRYIPNFLAEMSATVFGIIYVAVLPSAIITLRKLGFTYALCPLILTWLFDTFAYIVGSLIGKHKLCEKVSPKKSIEGLIFGIILTFPCTYYLNKLWFPYFNVVDAIILTLGIGILGTVGDVMESGMKREAGLKDASNIFPGHGGFLDRLDSLIFNIPFFYLYVIYYG
jgi:phosphatidate cytidylyltransferase